MNSTLPDPDDLEPGWKEDTSEPAMMRFWDGKEWKEQASDPVLADSPTPSNLWLVLVIMAAIMALTGFLAFAAVPMLIGSLVLFFVALGSWFFDKARGK